MLKQQEKLRTTDQNTLLEQQALQAMMNPHFIFNVMNSIQHYINSNEKHKANIYLSDFASHIRTNLDISSKRYIGIDDEVAYLELYLSLESVRFGHLLTYTINVDNAVDGDLTMIPVLLIQPFIENAIWHGIMPKKEKGHLQVDKERND
jgi:LytS/YehU family sensor histidine kinase